MKRTYVYWAGIVAVIGIVAFQFRPIAVDDKAAVTGERIENHSADNVAPLESVDERPDVESAELDDSATEIVMGLRVRKDRNCTVTRRYVDVGNGTVVEGFSCIPNEPPIEDPYDQYDNPTLASLAYSDPVAAAELGRRLVEDDPEESRALLIRSVALEPTNADPLLWLADVSYSIVARNGEPQVDALSSNYVLSRLAEQFSDASFSSHAQALLTDAGFTPMDFRVLEEMVQQDLQIIRQIQIEINGSTDIPEVSL